MKILAAIVLALCAGTVVTFGQQAARTPVAAPLVRWTPAGLSVHAAGAPLGSVLREVAVRTGMGVAGTDRLPDRVWVQFDDLALEDGLRVLLRNVNYVLRFDVGDSPARAVLLVSNPDGPSPSSAVVHRRGTTASSSASSGADHDGGGWEPAEDVTDPGIDDSVPLVTPPPEDDVVKAFEESGVLESGDVSEIAAGLQSESPIVRKRVIERLATEDPSRVVPTLEGALKDPDPAVRNSALTTIGRMAGADAASRLGQLLRDSNPTVRETAVRAAALRQDPDRLDLIRGAMTDADPGVRAVATVLYRQFQPAR